VQELERVGARHGKRVLKSGRRRRARKTRREVKGMLRESPESLALLSLDPSATTLRSLDVRPGRAPSSPSSRVCVCVCVCVCLCLCLCLLRSSLCIVHTRTHTQTHVCDFVGLKSHSSSAYTLRARALFASPFPPQHTHTVKTLSGSKELREQIYSRINHQLRQASNGGGSERVY